MARAISSLERAGLVVGLCPDPEVYEKLAIAVCERGLTQSNVRAAGTTPTLRVVREHAGNFCETAWSDNLYEIIQLEELAFTSDFAKEPLLDACFAFLSKMPAGGAPWQGSWRRNALSDVVNALSNGGIILVVEAHTLEEQRDWARTLLKSGCAFVQTHDGVVSP